MTIHVPFANQPQVVETDNHLILRTLLRVGDTDADLSITWVEIDGSHRRLRTMASTRIYVVLEGDATFHIDGNDDVHAVTGDLVVIPAGQAYGLDGTMTYLVINQPGFRPGDDVYVEGTPH